MMQFLWSTDFPSKVLEFCATGLWYHCFSFMTENISYNRISWFNRICSTFIIAPAIFSSLLDWHTVKLWMSGIPSWATEFSGISRFHSFGEPWINSFPVIHRWTTGALGWAGQEEIGGILGSSHTRIWKLDCTFCLIHKVNKVLATIKLVQT